MVKGKKVKKVEIRFTKSKNDMALLNKQLTCA